MFFATFKSSKLRKIFIFSDQITFIILFFIITFEFQNPTCIVGAVETQFLPHDEHKLQPWKTEIEESIHF